MLTEKEAKKIGVRACVNKIGYEFCKKYADNSVACYGKEEGVMTCFVGVDNTPPKEYADGEWPILTQGNEWPYYANCNVAMTDGTIEFGNCKIPEGLDC